MGIMVRYRKVSIPEFDIKTRYRKVSIPEKVSIPNTRYFEPVLWENTTKPGFSLGFSQKEWKLSEFCTNSTIYSPWRWQQVGPARNSLKNFNCIGHNFFVRLTRYIKRPNLMQICQKLPKYPRLGPFGGFNKKYIYKTFQLVNMSHIWTKILL